MTLLDLLEGRLGGAPAADAQGAIERSLVLLLSTSLGRPPLADHRSIEEDRHLSARLRSVLNYGVPDLLMLSEQQACAELEWVLRLFEPRLAPDLTVKPLGAPPRRLHLRIEARLRDTRTPIAFGLEIDAGSCKLTGHPHADL